MDLMTKTCTKCHQEKPLESYAIRPDRVGRREPRQARCRSCMAEVNAESYKRRKQRDPNYAQRTSMKQALAKYGLTMQDYEEMLRAQDGKCAICHVPATARSRRLAVDHCHRTGRVRGLLCVNCSTGIGGLGDDVDTVFSAAAYLLEHSDALEEVVSCRA